VAASLSSLREQTAVAFASTCRQLQDVQLVAEQGMPHGMLLRKRRKNRPARASSATSQFILNRNAVKRTFGMPTFDQLEGCLAKGNAEVQLLGRLSLQIGLTRCLLDEFALERLTWPILTRRLRLQLAA
jgi:preprotein translocase subunit SecA